MLLLLRCSSFDTGLVRGLGWGWGNGNDGAPGRIALGILFTAAGDKSCWGLIRIIEECGEKFVVEEQQEYPGRCDDERWFEEGGRTNESADRR